MQPGAYINISIKQDKFDQLTSLYTNWSLGIKEFSHKRRDRINKGIPTSATRENVLQGGDFKTSGIGALRTRLSEDGNRWVLHWVHQDRNKAINERWHNVVLIDKAKSSIRLQHLTARTMDSGSPTPFAAAPAILPVLVKEFSDDIYPTEVQLENPTSIEAHEVEAFVNQYLSNNLSVPIVIISKEIDTEKYLIDANKIFSAVRGTAHVFVLKNSGTSWAFRAALINAGLPEEIACYDGSIRVIPSNNKKISKKDLFYYPSKFIKRIPPKIREQVIGGYIVKNVAGNTASTSTLSIIEQIDLAKWRERTNSVLNAPALVQQENTEDEILQLNTKIKQLESTLKESQDMQDYFDKEHKKLSKELDEKELKISELEQERIDAPFDFELQSAKDALLLAEKVFSERLIILDSAKKSVDSCQFRNPNDLFGIMSVLANSCGESALSIPDVVNTIFGNRAKWKPKEHDQTMATFGGQRQHLDYSKNQTIFQKHITLGHGQYETKCMQVYFEKAPGGKIQIAYCGKHLSTFSRDA